MSSIAFDVAFDPYRSALAALAAQNRLRTLAPRQGLDFTSNDYLGLARSKRLALAVTSAIESGTPIGAGGSRLLRGNTAEHEQLEQAAARFFHAEHALLFGGGYVANFALFSTLPQRGDIVLWDELSHASVREGLRAGRAEAIEFPHNDIEAAEQSLRAWREGGGRGRVWIAVESIYSMDGDRAPLSNLMKLADHHDAFLLIDEAHATGVFGPDGRGLSAALEGRPNVIVLHTLGKALGGSGALVTGPTVLCDFLIARCRPFIYATAPSPLMAVAALEALKILKDEPERRQRLQDLTNLADTEARRLRLPSSGSQILPVILGAEERAMRVAAAIRERGFDVRGVRPPTVPVGTARLRISLTLNVDDEAVKRLFAALAEELETASA